METKNIIKTGAASAAAIVAGGAAIAQDWTGPYAGAAVMTSTGTSPYQPYVDYDEGYTIGATPSYAAFGGIRWAAGNMVMGVEAAISSPINADAADYGDSDPTDYMLNGLTDIKISAGMPLGNALVYGFGGVSFATGTGGDTTEVYTTSGGNLGLGIDYRINDKMSVGAEYIQRTMSGYTSGGNPDPYKPFSSVSLRTSFHF